MKKVISLLLAVAMTATTFTAVYAEEAEEVATEEVVAEETVEVAEESDEGMLEAIFGGAEEVAEEATEEEITEEPVNEEEVTEEVIEEEVTEEPVIEKEVTEEVIEEEEEEVIEPIVISATNPDKRVPYDPMLGVKWYVSTVSSGKATFVLECDSDFITDAVLDENWDSENDCYPIIGGVGIRAFQYEFALNPEVFDFDTKPTSSKPTSNTIKRSTTPNDESEDEDGDFTPLTSVSSRVKPIIQDGVLKFSAYCQISEVDQITYKGDQYAKIAVKLRPEYASYTKAQLNSMYLGECTFCEAEIVETYGSGALSKTSFSTSGESDYGFLNMDIPSGTTGVTLNKDELEVIVGEGDELTALVSGDDSGIIWKSSDEDIATVSGGYVFGMKVGTAKVYAVTVAGGKVAECEVTVKPSTVSVESVSLNQSSVNLLKGANTTLVATVNPDNATDQSVTWTTSDANVATVSNGVVTAVGNGDATITVTTTDGSKTATCTVHVTTAVTGVSLNKASATLNVGETDTLVATVAPADASNKNVTWSTSKASVATVSNGVVTAVGNGEATITVTTEDGSKTDTYIVTVRTPVASVSLNESAKAMNVGDEFTLTATVLPDTASNKAISWSTSNDQVATVSNGVVTAVGNGDAVITVTTADGNKTATCAVTVTTPVASVSLNKTEAALNPGTNVTLVQTVLPETASNKNVTWTSSDEGVAKVVNGVVTGVANGTATITVTTVDGSKTATCTVTVTTPVTGVSLNKTSTSLFVGGTETLNATIDPTMASDKTVTWSSDKPAVAEVDSNGKVTAKSNGTATITVTTKDGGYEANCTVIVTTPVASVSLDTTTKAMKVGDSFTLTETVAPATASNKNVTWSTSNDKVAIVTDGVVTAVGNGDATITVTTEDGSKTATCTVTVTTDVVSVSLNKTETALNVGQTEKLIATINPGTASVQDVTWTSSADAIASVAQDGTVTANSNGTATITVTTKDGSKTATCVVTVTTPVTGVSLDKESFSMAIGATKTLTATVAPADASAKDVTWESDDDTVATVSNGVVTAQGVGTATITVKTVEGGYTAACTVTVKGSTPIINEDGNTYVDLTEALEAESDVMTVKEAYYADGETVALPDDVSIDVTYDRNLRNAVVSTGAGTSSIRYGAEIITGDNIVFGDDGYIDCAVSKNVKIEKAYPDRGVTAQGFVFAVQGETVKETDSITFGFVGGGYDGRTWTYNYPERFRGTGKTIYGLQINKIPEGVQMFIKED